MSLVVAADRGEEDFDLVFRYPSTAMRWTMTSSLNEFAACMWLRPAISLALSSPVAMLSLYERASQPMTSQTNNNNGMTIAADVGGSNEVSVVPVSVAKRTAAYRGHESISFNYNRVVQCHSTKRAKAHF